MKLYWILFLTGVIFGLCETAYFGWNLHPQSEAERICDYIAICLIIASCLAKPSTQHYHIKCNEVNINKDKP